MENGFPKIKIAIRSLILPFLYYHFYLQTEHKSKLNASQHYFQQKNHSNFILVEFTSNFCDVNCQSSFRVSNSSSVKKWSTNGFQLNSFSYFSAINCAVNLFCITRFVKSPNHNVQKTNSS